MFASNTSSPMSQTSSNGPIVQRFDEAMTNSLKSNASRMSNTSWLKLRSKPRATSAYGHILIDAEPTREYSHSGLCIDTDLSASISPSSAISNLESIGCTPVNTDALAATWDIRLAAPDSPASFYSAPEHMSDEYVKQDVVLPKLSASAPITPTKSADDTVSRKLTSLKHDANKKGSLKTKLEAFLGRLPEITLPESPNNSPIASVVEDITHHYDLSPCSVKTETFSREQNRGLSYLDDDDSAKIDNNKGKTAHKQFKEMATQTVECLTELDETYQRKKDVIEFKKIKCHVSIKFK